LPEEEGLWDIGPSTEVQRVSFVGYTGDEGGSSRLWNLQNLHAVPPYGGAVLQEMGNAVVSYGGFFF